MTDQELRELKAALIQMEVVVKKLHYNNKLKSAWRRLEKAVRPALSNRKEVQPGLFD